MVSETQQIIQSLQLIISHQVRPYLSVMTISGLSLTCFRTIWGKLGPNTTQIPYLNVRETHKVIQSLELIISHQMRP